MKYDKISTGMYILIIAIILAWSYKMYEINRNTQPIDQAANIEGSDKALSEDKCAKRR